MAVAPAKVSERMIHGLQVITIDASGEYSAQLSKVAAAPYFSSSPARRKPLPRASRNLRCSSTG
jgi:hypothetical protein